MGSGSSCETSVKVVFRNNSWDRGRVSRWGSRSVWRQESGYCFVLGLGLGFGIRLNFETRSGRVSGWESRSDFGTGVEVGFQDEARIRFWDRD